MRKFHKSPIAGLITRIFFYGLFFVGPCALTESHALHVRMKQKCPIVDDKATDGETYREYHRRSMRNCLLQNAKRCQSTAYSFAVFDTAGGDY